MRTMGIGCLTAALLSPLTATAAVLGIENRARLCTASFAELPDMKIVDPDMLARAITFAAKAGLYLDGANPTGTEDGNIQGKTIAVTQGTTTRIEYSEPAYAVVNYGTASRPEANKPFGPNIDLKQNEDALNARNAIENVLLSEVYPLMDKGASSPTPELTYKLVRRDGGRVSTNIGNWPQLFDPNPQLVIACDYHPRPPAPPIEPSAFSKFVAGVTENVRLRGSVKDLSIGRDELRAAKAASITYERDGRADTKTFGLNGVVGLNLKDKDGMIGAIPFISYENRSVKGDDGDIEKLSPGILLSYRPEKDKKDGPPVVVHTALEASFIEDIQEKSQQAKLRLYVDPSFKLNSGSGTLFGSSIWPIGPLHWRPDLTLIADATKILDEGNSAALADASSYLGLGGELRLTTWLELGKPISEFKLQGGIRNLWLLGDIELQAARRWYASLTYEPEDFPFLGIGLSASKGENDDTLQKEDIYSLNFTVRY